MLTLTLYGSSDDRAARLNLLQMEKYLRFQNAREQNRHESHRFALQWGRLRNPRQASGFLEENRGASRHQAWARLSKLWDGREQEFGIMYAQVLGSREEKISKTLRVARVRMPSAWITHPDFLRAMKNKPETACYRLANSEGQMLRGIRERGLHFDESQLRVAESCLLNLGSQCAAWAQNWDEGANKSSRSVFDNPRKLEHVLQTLFELRLDIWPTQEPFSLGADWSENEFRFTNVDYHTPVQSDDDLSQKVNEGSFVDKRQQINNNRQNRDSHEPLHPVKLSVGNGDPAVPAEPLNGDALAFRQDGE